MSNRKPLGIRQQHIGASKMKTITIDGIEYQLTPVPTEAPKLVQWEPKANLGKKYHYFTVSGDLASTRYTGHSWDNECLSFGNRFHTEAEAQEAAKQVRQLLRLRAYVREFAPDYTPDWTNDSEQKWYIFFDEKFNEWSYSSNQYMRTAVTVYMPEQVAKELACKLNSGEVVL